uniref:Uncharacterized protein n=1 Tax=Oryza brachyantha TaxID=4533 RepID=J3MDS0_ORYBR
MDGVNTVQTMYSKSDDIYSHFIHDGTKTCYCQSRIRMNTASMYRTKIKRNRKNGLAWSSTKVATRQNYILE